MVLVRHRNLSQHVMESSQFYRVDEEQAFYGTENEHFLPWDSNFGPTLLGTGDLCQLHLLQ